MIKPRIGLHLIVILSSTLVFGILLNHELLALGVTSLIIRNVEVMVASYAIFFILMKVWIFYLKKNPRDLHIIASDPKSEEKKKIISDFRLLDCFNFDGHDGESLVIFLLIIGVFIGLIGIANWLSSEGPAMMIDAACEVALSTGLIRSSRKIGTGNWYEGVLSRTIVPFFIVLLTTTLVLSVATATCPGKNRFSEVVTQCWF